MIDHLSLPVADYGKSKAFYQAILEQPRCALLMERPISAGVFGAGGKPSFWIKQNTATAAVHVAFSSPDRASVDAFHALAISAGATDNGPPGLRGEYHGSYYGAFVIDPDGNNIEAVCHAPD